MSGSKMARPTPATPRAEREGPGWRFARSVTHAFGSICRNAGHNEWRRRAKPPSAGGGRDPEPVIVTTTGIRARGCDNDGVDGPPGGGRAPGNAPAVPPGTAGYLLGQPPGPCGWPHSREISGGRGCAPEGARILSVRHRRRTAVTTPSPSRNMRQSPDPAPNFRRVPSFRHNHHIIRRCRRFGLRF